MNYGNMGNIPPEKWRKEALVSKVVELQEQVNRLTGQLRTVGSTGDRIREERTIRIHKKKKGVVDKQGIQHVKNSLKNNILSGLLSMTISIPAAAAAGEFTIFLLLAGLCQSVFGPIIKYVEKRQEVF